MFGQLPVFCSLDGWPEPFHLLNWLDLIFEPASNPSGKVGGDAPRRLLLIDGYKFRIDPEFFVTCWQKNIFCVCIARDGASFFNLVLGALAMSCLETMSRALAWLD
jgi:hypothetical protein